MKASDEWLVILGGIGTVVLLFQIFQKSNKTGAYATPQASTESVPGSPGYTPDTTQSMFTPAPESINIGATTIGGDTYNMGSNLFPYFGYAVQNNGLSSLYAAINELMNNNADYQNQQAQVNNNYAFAQGLYGGL